MYDGRHLMGVNMGEVILLIPKSERERIRLVQEARAIYDSVFPPADPVSEQQDMAPISHTVSAPVPITRLLTIGREVLNTARGGRS
jgi:hypothetical protein